jgi:hypothetical protein
MEATERDSTQDWLLPEGAVPPLLSEIELRIDEALAIARASEQAVKVVGGAAIDAAKQALRAAELAERASATALDVQRRVARAAEVPRRDVKTPPRPKVLAESESLRSFTERADRVVARLRELERSPERIPPATVGGGPPRPVG